jgi:hypothetical protein
MVNVGLGWSSMVGIALAIAGASLYFLRSFRPGLARDHDIFFAAVSLLCGGILFFQGWRQDPILQFGQFLLAGSAIFFAYESIRLRGVATEQAKRTMPVVDDERPVSRVYRAELDDYNALEERPAARRIRSARDSRSSQVDEYGNEVRRPSSSKRGGAGSDRTGSEERPSRPPRRSSRPEGGQSSQREESRFSVDEDPKRSVWDDEDGPRNYDASSYGDPNYDAPTRPTRKSSSTTSRPKRTRPSQGSPSSRRKAAPESTSSDYADYQPIDYSEGEADNSSNFD